MKTCKNILAVIIVFCFTVTSYASNEVTDKTENSKGEKEVILVSENKSLVKKNVFKDCTISVDTEIDGVTVKGTVTFKDVSWWDCAQIKIANFFS